VVAVSTRTGSETAKPPRRPPVTVPSCVTPPSSPKTLSLCSVSLPRWETDRPYPGVA
jgi:hypothetical protein